jgi:hypothetical protein
MPFRTIEDPAERGILTVALEEYCQENRIDPASDEYDDARQLLIMLYERQGQHTVANLKAALVAAIHRER